MAEPKGEALHFLVVCRVDATTYRKLRFVTFSNHDLLFHLFLLNINVTYDRLLTKICIRTSDTDNSEFLKPGEEKNRGKLVSTWLDFHLCPIGFLPGFLLSVRVPRKLGRTIMEREMKKQLLVFTGVHQMAALYTGNVVRQSRYITGQARINNARLIIG